MMKDKLKLIDAYLDGELTPESAAALDAWLRQHADHLEIFVRETHLHRELRDVLCGQASQGADPNDSPPKSPVLGFLADAFRQGRDYFSHPTPFSTLVAVATIGSLLTLLAIWAAPLYRSNSRWREPAVGSPYVARLTGTVDCQWADEQVPPLPLGEGRGEGAPLLGQFLRAGRQLDLTAGLAEITFNSGVRIVLEGASDFKVESENSGRLIAGRLAARVPPGAVGFTVETPNARITDLGTEFGVEVKSDDSTEVHVFQGRVEAELVGQTGATLKRLRIGQGQAARLDSSGAEITPKAVDIDRFVRKLPLPGAQDSDAYARSVLASRPLAYWRMNETGGTRAADASGHGNHASYEAAVRPGAAGLPAHQFPGLEKNNRAAAFPGSSKAGARERLKADLKGLPRDYTIEMWFCNTRPVLERSVTGTLYSRGLQDVNESPGDHLSIRGSNRPKLAGSLTYFNGDQAHEVVPGTSKLAPRTWSHVAVVRNGRRVAVYLNGKATPEASGEAGVMFNAAGGQICVGGRSNRIFGFQGRIDEVAVYDRSLPAEEIVGHYRAAVEPAKNATKQFPGRRPGLREH